MNYSKELADKKKKLQDQQKNIQAELDKVSNMLSKSAQVSALETIQGAAQAAISAESQFKTEYAKLAGTVASLALYDKELFDTLFEEYRKTWLLKHGAERAARHVCWTHLTNNGWSIEAWMDLYAFSVAFDARRNVISKALANVNTDRGDDSHGDLCDALTLYLEDTELAKLIEDPKNWPKCVSRQSAPAFSANRNITTLAHDLVLHGENYLGSRLSDAVKDYFKQTHDVIID